MTTVAHISDLHFGTEEKRIVEGLIKELNSINPVLVIVSGDLTQRARSNQFKRAADFLRSINAAKIIVPGNHDVPLFDIFRRFFLPYKRYKKYINKNLNPSYEDENLFVLALNTSRSLTWKNGRISLEQMDLIRKRVCAADDKKIKIVVTHHPFIPPPGEPGIDLVGRSLRAIKIMDECKVQLLLAGHLHHGYSGDVRPYYPKGNSSIISIQAGTAVSNRIRNEPNAYNLIKVDSQKIKVDIRRWNGKFFEEEKSTSYFKTGEEWIREK